MFVNVREVWIFILLLKLAHAFMLFANWRSVGILQISRKQDSLARFGQDSSRTSQTSINKRKRQHGICAYLLMLQQLPYFFNCFIVFTHTHTPVFSHSQYERTTSPSQSHFTNIIHKREQAGFFSNRTPTIGLKIFVWVCVWTRLVIFTRVRSWLFTNVILVQVRSLVLVKCQSIILTEIGTLDWDVHEAKCNRDVSCDATTKSCDVTSWSRHRWRV